MVFRKMRESKELTFEKEKQLNMFLSVFSVESSIFENKKLRFIIY